jgi:hypothetical protein
MFSRARFNQAAAMSSLTISNLDTLVLQRLRDLAHRQGKSESELAAELIEQAVRSDSRPTGSNGRGPRDVKRLAGTWTEEQADAFDRAVASFGQVDEDLWK